MKYLEHVPVGIGVVELSGKITYLNAAFIRLFGYTIEQIPTVDAWTIPAFPDPVYRAKALQDWLSDVHELVSTGASCSLPRIYRVCTSLKEYIQVEVTSAFVDNRLIVTFTDVTDLFEAVHRLEESESRYRTLFENMTSAFAYHEMIYDSNGKAIDYRFIEVNPACQKMLNIDSEDICGKTVMEVFPTTETFWIETYNEVATTGKELTIENYSQALDRHFSVYAYSPKPGYFAVIFNDITIRKKMEERLQKSESMYRLLVEKVPMVVVRINENQLIEYINPFGEKTFGYSNEEIIGKHILETIVPAVDSEGKNLKSSMDQIFLNPENFTDFSNENITKDGKHIWFRWGNRPIYQQDGSFAGMLCVGIDITKQKSAEADLRQFVYAVSHDLKAPLVTILGFSKDLVEDIELNDQDSVKTDLKYIQNAARKMSRMLDELLNLSRIESLEIRIKEFLLQDLIRDVIDLLGGRIKVTQAVIEYPDKPILIVGDMNRVLHVFQNLFDNALKFMGTQAQPKVKLKVGFKKGELLFCIEDNGIGIEPKHQKRLFNLFHKLDPKAEGTGLGLVLVKRIIEAHQGRIWLESEGAGLGTRIYFTLPGSKYIT